ncbi:hypothetical protein A1QO_04085 [Vibrio genomosp. F10 str. ZF-129]|uniref:GLUG domain-containing protein n=1 Tax=Vibrio genomosp. F10 str. ZF-129 TaxID=1187848 RepID=A0A1E5BIN4_9VIBR|nr:hypothetical protein [Vibrio genomosp. F10]OEE37291.1 hypothetical protein A1QO_04085 [Vibrio genomosp. F10 str. ZF-129]
MTKSNLLSSVAITGMILLSTAAHATSPIMPLNGEISSLAELRWLSENSTGWGNAWQLTADIDASDSMNWNHGDHDNDPGTSDEYMGFTPIGLDSDRFTGSFDGNGFTISNLFINRPNTRNIGLFGYVDSGTIQNLNLSDVSITGYREVAGLIGTVASVSSTPLIKNISVTGTLSGNGAVAALVASQDSTTPDVTIDTIDLDITINSTQDAAGAMALLRAGTASNIHVKGDISGQSVGGVFGGIYGDASLDTISYDGVIVASSGAGGLIENTYTSLPIRNIEIKATIQTSDGGGIALRAYDADIVSAAVDVTIESTDEGQIGGGFATTYNSSISDLEMKATLLEGEQSGGVAAYADNLTISDATLNSIVTASTSIGSSSRYGGAFGYAYDVKASDIDITTIVNSPQGYVGGYGGYVTSTTTDIAESYANTISISGTVSSLRDKVGGFAGGVYTSSVTNLFLDDVQVETPDNQVGGISGFSAQSVFDAIYGSVTVNGYNEVGAISGVAYATTATRISVDTEVTGTSKVGAGFGYAPDVNASNIQLRGTVEGANDYVGAFIGHGGGTLNRIMLLVDVSGLNYVGGVLGSTIAATALEKVIFKGDVKSSNYGGSIIGSDTKSAEATLVYHSATGSYQNDLFGEAVSNSDLMDQSFYSDWNLASAWGQGDWFMPDYGMYPTPSLGYLPEFVEPTESEGEVPAVIVEAMYNFSVQVEARDGSGKNKDVTYYLDENSPTFVTVDTFGLVVGNPVETDEGLHSIMVYSKTGSNVNALPPFQVVVTNNTHSGDENDSDISSPGDADLESGFPQVSSGGASGFGTILALMVLLLIRRDRK